jgi:hypothetical protein
VQLLRDSRALGEPFLEAEVELRAQLMHPIPVEGEDGEDPGGEGREPKPPRLPEHGIALDARGRDHAVAFGRKTSIRGGGRYEGSTSRAAYSLPG